VARPVVKQTHKLPVCYCSPELVAFAEDAAKDNGGVSAVTRKLWENYLRGLGYPIGTADADRAEQIQQRIAELRSEIAPRQPKANASMGVS
jgi:hypothetical protein